MMFDLPWSKLWVVGLAQNCEEYLPAVLANIEALGKKFRSAHVLIFENDSTDNTVDVIKHHANADLCLKAISFKGLNERIPVKTLRLAHLRNGTMDWLKQHQAFTATNLVLVLDLDNVNSLQWNIDNFDKVLSWFAGVPSAAGVFANQLGPYYDLWALRHSVYCKDDIWENLMRFKLSNPSLDSNQLYNLVIKPRQLNFKLNQSPFEVVSAFGGLGFYKGEWLACQQSQYCGETTLLITQQQKTNLVRWQVAEHVNFNIGLRAAGASLWIHPALINWNTIDIAHGLNMNPESWRHMAF